MKLITLFLTIISCINLNAQSATFKLEKKYNDSISLYSAGKYNYLINVNSQKIKLDKISNIITYDSLKCFIARTDVKEYDSIFAMDSITITSKWFLYNLEGIKIISEPIFIIETVVADLESLDSYKTYFLIPNEYTKDKNFIILNTQEVEDTFSVEKSGVVDLSKGLIIPFIYNKIEISPDDQIFLAYDNKSETPILYDRNGKIIQKK